MKKIFALGTLFSMISLALLAHEDPADPVYTLELIYQKNSLESFLKAEQSNRKLSEKEMNAFVFGNQQLIQNEMAKFWSLSSAENASKSAINSITKTKEALKQLMDSFYDERSSNTGYYKDKMNKWTVHQASISSPPASPPPSPTICDNVDFEKGDFSGWYVWLGGACMFDKTMTCNSFLVNNYAGAYGAGRLEVISTPGFDVNATTLPMICPGGSHSLRLENKANGGDATQVKYTFTVDISKPIYAYKFALVLQEPGGNGHHPQEKPYFRVTFHDDTDNEDITCGEYMVYADGADKRFASDQFVPIEPNSLTKFLPWTTNKVDFVDRIGHNISVTFTVSDCVLKGHYGYAYIDGECLNDPYTIGPCLSDGTREISVAGVFDKYIWQGPGILESNEGVSIKVDKGGRYTLKRYDAIKCRTTQFFDVDTCPPPPAPTPCQINITSHTIGACNNNNNLFDLDLNFTLSNVPDNGVIKIQDGKIEHFLYLPQTSPVNFSLKNLLADGETHTIKVSLYADNYIAENNALCTQSLNILAPNPCYIVSDLACENCIGSFAPTPGEKYVLSAWVKDPGSINAETYGNPFIQIKYTGASPNPTPAIASGKVIEGWQRIYFEFTIPIGTTALEVELGTLSGTALFDDIRIYPVKSSMKSYVYDPVSLKLVAELDENNYATFYEYDEEGTLIRTKKETERGVVTITENRQSNPKK